MGPTCIQCKKAPCECVGVRKPKQQPTLKDALSEIVASMTEQIQLVQIRAQLCRAYHKELLKQGFTKNEALALCKEFRL